MTTALVLIVSIVIGAVALWYLNRVVSGDGLGHRPPPRSHRSDLEAGSPMWEPDTRSTGSISWTYSEGRRQVSRQVQPHH